MRFSDIKYTDMINGEGIRVSIFVSGCSHRCKGCFNVETWDKNNGKEFDLSVENRILEYFEKYQSSLKGVSLLGGDPTFSENIDTLVKFLKRFKAQFPDKDIWIWSGYEWETIIKTPKLLSLIELCDILIDGKYKENKRDLTLKWRGSKNQRVIDIQKSLLLNQISIYG